VIPEYRKKYTMPNSKSKLPTNHNSSGMLSSVASNDIKVGANEEGLFTSQNHAPVVVNHTDLSPLETSDQLSQKRFNRAAPEYQAVDKQLAAINVYAKKNLIPNQFAWASTGGAQRLKLTGLTQKEMAVGALQLPSDYQAIS
jgi:hypothetical protein